MNSCSSSSLSACAPPLITFSIGVGRTWAFGPPRERHSGNACASAAALAVARETPRIAFAPSVDLSSEPSRARRARSIARWSFASIPISAGAIASCTFATARRTPLPSNRPGSPSRSSSASCSRSRPPRERPHGRRRASSSSTSTSTVGLPRESRISRARMASSIRDIGLKILGRRVPQPGISPVRRLHHAGGMPVAGCAHGEPHSIVEEPARPEPCCFDEWAVHSASRARRRGVGAPITGRMLSAGSSGPRFANDARRGLRDGRPRARISPEARSMPPGSTSPAARSPKRDRSQPSAGSRTGPRSPPATVRWRRSRPMTWWP